MKIKVDKLDKRILFELDKNCRIPEVQLAKKIKKSREIVRYRINKMQEEGVIQGFVTSLNPSKFGYSFFKIYFKLKNKKQGRQELINYFKKLKETYWYSESYGFWDFHTTVYCENLERFNEIKKEVSLKFKNLILKKDFGTLIKVRQYLKNYLTNSPDFSSTYFAGEVIENKLDEMDKKILGVLISNARISLVDLSYKTKSTIEIVRNRMKKLKEKEIILGYRVAIDHSKISLGFFKLFLFFESISKETQKNLLEYATQNKNINYLIEQLSSWDYELELMVEDYAKLTEIIDEIKEKFSGQIKDIEFALMKGDNFAFKDKVI